MEKYAIIKLGSAQYTVKPGDIFEVEKQVKPLKFDVLFYFDGEKGLAGDPVLRDVSVKLIVVEEKRDRKIVVGRFKSKSRYRKKRGHRQELSVLKVESVGGESRGEKTEKTEKNVKVEKSEKTEKDAKAVKVTSASEAVASSEAKPSKEVTSSVKSKKVVSEEKPAKAVKKTVAENKKESKKLPARAKK